MKITGSLLFITILLFHSCLDRDLPRVNGMWQLKTIKNEEGEIERVDTIYYSFQRQTLFSYTLLNEKPNEPASFLVRYGYVNFPDENIMQIQMDAQYPLSQFEDIPRLEKYMTFTILHLDSKKMVLSNEQEVYNFIKF